MFYPGGGYAGFYFWLIPVADTGTQEYVDFDATFVSVWALEVHMDRDIDEPSALIAALSYDLEAER